MRRVLRNGARAVCRCIMALSKDIIRRALRLLGVVARGQEPTGADAADGLEHLQSLILDLPGLLNNGRWREVSTSVTYTAHESDRVTASGAITVSLPLIITDCGCSRPPRDMARVQILGAVTGAGLWIYSATKGAWGRADALTLTSEIPFGSEDEIGLAATLAVNMAAEYGAEAELGQRTVTLSVIAIKSLRSRFMRVQPIDWSRPEPLGPFAIYGSDGAAYYDSGCGYCETVEAGDSFVDDFEDQL